MRLKSRRTTKPPLISRQLVTNLTIMHPVYTKLRITVIPGRRSAMAYLPNAFTRVVREDDVRRDLLFAGTELGLFISWNGGKDWSPFQLNLPITPITDLRVHKGNLIAATSGRSFWILDDLSVLRQYKKDGPSFAIYRPEGTYLVNGGSELDGTNDEFTGASTFRGVNPATGVVLYYQLPELKKGDEISLEIKDAAGNTVRNFSSKADEKFIRYDSGPRPDPLLPKNKGLNRFVWDLRYQTMVGVPERANRRWFRCTQSTAGTLHGDVENGRTDSRNRSGDPCQSALPDQCHDLQRVSPDDAQHGD